MANTVKFTLRIPDDLHARIAAQAKADLRSLNAEMLYLLQVGLETVASRNGGSSQRL